MSKKATLIEIDGVVDVSGSPVTHDEFLDEFIEWLEDNGWSFGGSTKEVKDE